MPAYDKPMVINVDRAGQLEPVAYGAVIQFVSTDKERIQRFIEELERRDIIMRTEVKSFNPDHGAPVWYIP